MMHGECMKVTQAKTRLLSRTVFMLQRLMHQFTG